VGLEITLSGSATTEFDKHHEELKKAGGNINVLGFKFDLGGSFESGSSSAEHKETWDKQTGKITISPSNLSGVTSLLAVIGTTIQI
jgi:hypothetical protein